MTRQEFIDEVNNWHALINFCDSEGCTICDDIYDESERDNVIDQYISELIESYSWHVVRDELYSIPTGGAYYRRYGDNNWEDADGDWDMFALYKVDVLRWMDSRGQWENEVAEDNMEDRGVEVGKINEEGVKDSDTGSTEETTENEDMPDMELFAAAWSEGKRFLSLGE